VSDSIYPPESRSNESRQREVTVTHFPKRCHVHGTELRRVVKLSGASWWECAECEREKEDAYAQGRRAGLEEAAQVADAGAERYRSSFAHSWERTLHERIAAAIRALATEAKR
jgi:flagellar biosynthesis/type III secretory pathway protein FliH